MKKIFISLGVVALGLVTFASCSSNKGDDLDVIRTDNPTTEVKTKYNLGFIDNLNDTTKALKLNPVDEDADSNYYAVYVSANYAETAFVYSINVTDDVKDLGNRLRQFDIATITFKPQVYKSEVSDIAKEVFNSEVGLPQFNGNGKFDFDIETNANLTKTLSINGVVKVKDDLDTITLDIAYMPIYVIRHYKGKSAAMDILRTVLFVPVYYCFQTNNHTQEITTDGELVASKLTNIRTDIVFDFDDDGYVKDGNDIEEA